MSNRDVLDLFNCMVVSDYRLRKIFNTSRIDYGIVTDFDTTAEDWKILSDYMKPLNMRTLFSHEERMSADLTHLLTKQFLHYIEVYGLDMPGLFNLEVDNGQLISLRYVRGITVSELQEKVDALLYTNAPVKDAAQVKRIIDGFGLRVRLNDVKNNELRVSLWNGDQAFNSGDDAVRYIVLKATESAMLIKSREVVEAVKVFSAKDVFLEQFLEQNAYALSQVFNRHKRIIMATKNRHTKSVVNKISRMSKKNHVPVFEPKSKTFISNFMDLKMGTDVSKVLSTFTVRDKLKFLNAVNARFAGTTTNLYKIRNGKVWYKINDKSYSESGLTNLQNQILTSLNDDLSFLRGKSILLDRNVDYGLPVSRKQTLGRLPFGTLINVLDSNEISSGVYWEDAWGARDLDLSGVFLDGDRVGWGCYGGYTRDDVVYSGDVTSAYDGAMEFLTSRNKDYGLVVNIFNGENGAEAELVVGNNSGKGRWMTTPIVREKMVLNSKNNLLGFVRGKSFVVYAGRMNDKIVSSVNPTLEAIKVDLWTVATLLFSLGIEFDIDRVEDKVYDYDLTYENFSFDKLEELFNATKDVP